MAGGLAIFGRGPSRTSGSLVVSACAVQAGAGPFLWLMRGHPVHEVTSMCTLCLTLCLGLIGILYCMGVNGYATAPGVWPLWAMVIRGVILFEASDLNSWTVLETMRFGGLEARRPRRMPWCNRWMALHCALCMTGCRVCWPWWMMTALDVLGWNWLVLTSL